jgi:hypothetical protein
VGVALGVLRDKRELDRGETMAARAGEAACDDTSSFPPAIELATFVARGSVRRELGLELLKNFQFTNSNKLYIRDQVLDKQYFLVLYLPRILEVQCLGRKNSDLVQNKWF